MRWINTDQDLNRSGLRVRGSGLLKVLVAPVLVLVLYLLLSPIQVAGQDVVATPAASAPAPGGLNAEAVAQARTALADAPNLTAEQVAQAEAALKAAEAFLTDTETFRNAAEQTQALVDSVPGRIKTLDESLAQPAPDVEALLAEADALPMAEAEAASQKAQRAVSDARAQRTRVEEALAAVQQRPEALQQRVLDLRDRLQTVSGETVPGDDAAALPAVLDQALGLARTAERGAVQAELEAIERERLAQDVIYNLRVKERETAVKQLADAEAVADAWRAVEQRRRQALSEQRAMEAEAARRMAQLRQLPEGIQALAQENVEISKQISETVEDTALQQAEAEAAKERTEQLNHQLRRAQKRIDASGLDKANGLLLRRLFDGLPDHRLLEDEASVVSAKIGTAETEHLDLEDQLSALSDLSEERAWIESVLLKHPEVDQAEAQRSAERFLREQTELLHELQVAKNRQIQALLDLDEAERALITSAQSFDAFIRQRLLWAQSSEPFRFGDLVLEAERPLMVVSNWRALGAEAKAAADRRPGLHGLLLLGLFLAVGGRWWIARQVRRLGQRAQHPDAIAPDLDDVTGATQPVVDHEHGGGVVVAGRVSEAEPPTGTTSTPSEAEASANASPADQATDEAKPARQAPEGETAGVGMPEGGLSGVGLSGGGGSGGLVLGLVVLRGLAVPLLVMGWIALVLGGPETDPFTYVVLRGVWHSMALWAAIDVARSVFLPGGLAEAFLGHTSAACRAARRHLTWAGLALLVLVTMVGWVEALDSDVYRRMTGRPAFLLAMGVIAVCWAVLLRPGGPLRASMMERSGTAFVRRGWSTGYVLGLVVFAVITGLAFQGYYYTAVFLQARLNDTAILIVVAWLLHDVGQRWIRTQQARLANRLLREGTTVSVSDRPFDQKAMQMRRRLRLEQSEQQARAAVRTGLCTAVLVIGYWIWLPALPALQFLDNVTLWTTTAMVDGQAAAHAVTLADVGLTLLLIVFTALAARSVPGVLEITLLMRLPIEAGARFAITTICRYLVIAVGVMTISQALGVQWDKLQWLVAALSVGLGFGLQEIVANFVSGLIVLFERPFRLGDLVTIGTVTGRVTRIQIRATTITNRDRQELIVPNKDFITGQVINWSLSDSVTRIMIPLVITHDSDAQLAKQLVLEAAREHELVLNEPEPSAVLKGITEHGVTLQLRVYVGDLPFRGVVNDELVNTIRERFAEAGIQIARLRSEVIVNETLVSGQGMTPEPIAGFASGSTLSQQPPQPPTPTA